MIKYIRLFTLALAFCAGSFVFTACNSSEIKGDHEGELEGSQYHGQEINPNDPALTPNTNDTIDTTGGTSGGMNTMDPEASGSGGMDRRQDDMNAGGNTNNNGTNTNGRNSTNGGANSK